MMGSIVEFFNPVDNVTEYEGRKHARSWSNFVHEPTNNLRSKEAVSSSIKDNGELLLVEDNSPVKNIKSNIVKSSKSRSKHPLPHYEDLSPYEKIRADNIREREELLHSLGIKEAIAEYKDEAGIGYKHNRQKKQTAEQTWRRKSSRLEGKESVKYSPKDRRRKMRRNDVNQLSSGSCSKVFGMKEGLATHDKAAHQSCSECEDEFNWPELWHVCYYTKNNISPVNKL